MGLLQKQYQQTFNLNAEARGSQYRVKVIEPNEVDIQKILLILKLNGNGKTGKEISIKIL